MDFGKIKKQKMQMLDIGEILWVENKQGIQMVLLRKHFGIKKTN